MFDLDIGIRLKELRQKHNLSQNDFGKLIGKDGTTIGRYEKGLLPIPSDVLVNIKKTYSYSIDYLLTGDAAYMHGSNNTDERILSLYGRLSDKDKKEIEEFIKVKLSLESQKEKLSNSPENIEKLMA